MAEKEVNAWATFEYVRQRIFDIDQALKGDGCRFKISPEDYTRAREGIVTIYAAVKEAESVPSDIGRAKSDTAYQQFLGVELTKPRRRLKD